MMKTDIEIAQECTMEPITEVAERAGIPEEYLEQYGKYKAKIDYNFLKNPIKRRKTDSCDGNQSDTCRRRKDNNNRRSCRCTSENG